MPLGLRAFSLLLGTGAIVVGYRLVLAIFPNDPLPALGTAAFAATLPMHLAMTSAVNNDVLVGLVLNLASWRLVTMDHLGWGARRSFVLGALLGLAMLSGLSAYAMLIVAVVALVWDGIRARHDGSGFWLWRILGYGAIMLGTAFVITLPWLLRNIQVYGPDDRWASAGTIRLLRPRPHPTRTQSPMDGLPGCATCLLSPFRASGGSSAG